MSFATFGNLWKPLVTLGNLYYRGGVLCLVEGRNAKEKLRHTKERKEERLIGTRRREKGSKEKLLYVALGFLKLPKVAK